MCPADENNISNHLDDMLWQPHAAKNGPLTVFFSGHHEQITVFRNGAEGGGAMARHFLMNAMTATIRAMMA